MKEIMIVVKLFMHGFAKNSSHMQDVGDVDGLNKCWTLTLETGVDGMCES